MSEPIRKDDLVEVTGDSHADCCGVRKGTIGLVTKVCLGGELAHLSFARDGGGRLHGLVLPVSELKKVEVAA